MAKGDMCHRTCRPRPLSACVVARTLGGAHARSMACANGSALRGARPAALTVRGRLPQRDVFAVAVVSPAACRWLRTQRCVHPRRAGHARCSRMITGAQPLCTSHAFTCTLGHSQPQPRPSRAPSSALGPGPDSSELQACACLYCTAGAATAFLPAAASACTRRL